MLTARVDCPSTNYNCVLLYVSYYSRDALYPILREQRQQDQEAS
jgi:hypothetical protein